MIPDDLLAEIDATVTSEGDPEAVVNKLIAYLDGRHPDDLVVALDALRERGAYLVSLPVLEQAWNAELDNDLAGRIAEDWVGTVLHGIGDRDGASEVAEHLVRPSIQRGPRFAGELGHVFLAWRLTDAAAPLVAEAARLLPGDAAVQFDFGVLLKQRGEFEASRAAFERVVLRHPEERSAWWNLGIACTALADWPGARRAWTEVGFQLPPGDGDIARRGEPTPVRLPTATGARTKHEVVWGHRLCPARVRLTGIPCFPRDATCGDTVLVDGEPVGEVPGPDGRPTQILPALATLEVLGGETVVAFSHRPAPLAAGLRERGWPAVDWTGLAGRTPRVAIFVATGRDREAAVADLRELDPDAEFSR